MSKRELIKKVDAIKPSLTTSSGEKLYSIDDYLTLANAEKELGESFVTSKGARELAPCKTQWKSSARIARAINEEVFFANTAKIKTEEIEGKEIKVVNVVFDFNLVNQQNRGIFDGRKINSYVFSIKGKKVSFVGIEEVKGEDFNHDFDTKLGKKTVLAMRTLLSDTKQDKRKTVDFV